ncbi:MAG: glutamate-1-semialdehyde-2,1-aminomutase [Candidatus Omnitrophica bacterium CG11_big_fil_rev_8_21_14_0_20_42_13]|uniref:Glutamate-1-semialdehyde 2,1-aminomutase n=1 Tax=Candidatus Ghiorseimicrobium undicola TaxID=1974746 RepID=A0A2H0M0R5_9BACT|nr:MAG: glutamate-1-semialdehyde-2,1-aminomutase [Candidatus Omnitrophica bacterium CG11_big_fil_rev_8_21_14_0_20_42_13]
MPIFIKSKQYFSQAQKVIPGGVNSPVRAFGAVGGEPVFIAKGKGAYIWDVDGNKYIDYVLSWGPMILGHADSLVIKEVTKTLKNGTSFGAPTKKETDLAKLISEIYPSIEKVRLVSSGTEAAMSAIRLARGYTGKDKIIKFEGCYHGHFDSLLVKAGSGLATFGVPSSAGVTKGIAQDTITLPFNDIVKVKEVIEKEKDNLACVIVEPVPANMGVILPRDNFLKELREITQKYNIVLIFDEVISGFRLALGGAQEVFGVKPDLTVLGKIIGGGFPIGAFGGKAQIMGYLSPGGPVYQAGTLSGNPVAVSAGLVTIKKLTKKNVYRKLDAIAEILIGELCKISAKAGQRIVINHIGSLFTIFFAPTLRSGQVDKNVISNYNDVLNCDLKKFAGFFRGMLRDGVYLAPSQFEANFISAKHILKDIKNTLSAAKKVLRSL